MPRAYKTEISILNTHISILIKMKKAEIKLQVELDENHVPENIMWSSTDGDNAEELPAKAMFLALWDAQYKNSMRIDLWTKDMPYDEMKRFFYETLQTLGDSFIRSSGGDPMAEKVIGDLRDYCAHFADKMEVLMPQQ
jgi:gliding motility-associated protein GldC